MLALDFDLGSVRCEPTFPLIETTMRWIMEGFRTAGADPLIGARLKSLLLTASLGDVQTWGIQDYLQPDDPRGPAMVSGVIRSLAPRIVSANIATFDELALDSLYHRWRRTCARPASSSCRPSLGPAQAFDMKVSYWICLTLEHAFAGARKAGFVGLYRLHKHC